MGDFYDGDNNQAGGYSPGLPENASSPPKKMRANQSLIPVTIKQIVEAPHGSDDQFRIDGRETNQLTFVGVIRNVAEHQTNIVYLVEDGTSSIEVKEWIASQEASEEAAQKHSNLREGIYVRVVGLLKTFHDKRSIAAYLMRPIVDFNEITHHFLEAIHTHLYNTRGPHALPQASSHQPQAAGQKTPSKPNQNQRQHQHQQHQQDDQAEQQTLPQQILQLLSTNKSDEGVSIQEIANVFREVATLADVRAAIDFLSNECLIYPTIDDQHYATTES